MEEMDLFWNMIVLVQIIVQCDSLVLSNVKYGICVFYKWFLKQTKYYSYNKITIIKLTYPL